MARRGSGPTIYDVARAAGLSTATVSRAINGVGQLSPTAREAVERAVRELGYRQNKIARSLVTHSTQTIALLLPDITNPFYPGLVKGVQDAARRRGYMLVLCTADGDPAGEEAYLNMLRERLVDGALVDGLVLTGEHIASIVGDGFPVVSLDRGIESPSVSLIQTDNRAGGMLATRHLIELGHRRIAHVTGVPGLRITSDRLAGYKSALGRAGIEHDGDLVATGDYTESGGRAATGELLARRDAPTAIFAANDLSAIGVLQALAERGLRVPDDVSVVGFDGLRLSAFVSPRLTTVRQPAYEIGERAAEVLFASIGKKRRKPERILLAPELVLGESTAAPARRARAAPGRRRARLQ
jgi:DNA-binding LacI/PurR family transcriptional regulator